MAPSKEAALSVALHRWAIHQRANIQLTLLALYDYSEHMKQPPDTGSDMRMLPPTTVLFDHLIGASFSLWRALFLTEKPRTPLSVHKAQRAFLKKLISTNAIAFSDDLQSSEWAVTFYLENAGHRIVAASNYARIHFPKEEIPAWLILSPEMANGSIVNALYEWELLHAGVRTLFKLNNPGSPLQIHKPDITKGWTPEDVSKRANLS